MNLDQLLDRLEDLGASLRFEGDRVYLRNGAALDAEDRELLRANRDAIRRLVKLRNRPAKQEPEAEPEPRQPWRPRRMTPEERRLRLHRVKWGLAVVAAQDREPTIGFPTRGPGLPEPSRFDDPLARRYH